MYFKRAFHVISGVIMSVVVILSRKCHINPDNVATPIAASLGDLTTLALLSGIAMLFYKAIGKIMIDLCHMLPYNYFYIITVMNVQNIYRLDDYHPFQCSLPKSVNFTYVHL